MNIFNVVSRWRRQIFLWVGLPAIAVAGLLFGGFDLVPAWQAKNGDGAQGTFTAVSQECSRRTCSWHGDFVTTGGTDHQDVRRDVLLYDAPDGLRTGDSVPALDTGARHGVFSASGGSTWLVMTGLVVAGVAAAVIWVMMVVRWLRRRRAPAPVGAH